MKKLLVCSISFLFCASIFAQAGAPANMQGYAACLKKNEAKLKEGQTLCDTEAKATLNQAKCIELTKISLKCQCDNNFNANPQACASLKGGKAAHAEKAATATKPAKKEVKKAVKKVKKVKKTTETM